MFLSVIGVDLFTGDIRVNQNAQLALLHVIFLREHIRTATILGKLNPHWDDERIFQETRNIIVASHQHIAYNEWLPLIFGMESLLKRKIIYNEDMFIDDYDPSKRAITFNEHAHSANRHFHSMIAQHLM